MTGRESERAPPGHRTRPVIRGRVSRASTRPSPAEPQPGAIISRFKDQGLDFGDFNDACVLLTQANDSLADAFTLMAKFPPIAFVYRVL